jgi:hypothetical protein
MLFRQSAKVKSLPAAAIQILTHRLFAEAVRFIINWTAKHCPWIWLTDAIGDSQKFWCDGVECLALA